VDPIGDWIDSDSWRDRVRPGRFARPWANLLSCIFFIVMTILEVGTALLLWVLVKLASAFAVSNINDVRNLAADATEEQWTTVERRAIRIGTDVAPAFSDAVSTPLVASYMGMIALGVGYGPHIILLTRESQKDEQVWSLMSALAMVVTGLALLYDPAYITTTCETFRNELNKKRVANDGSLCSPKLAARLENMERLMDGLNYGAGMGFSILGTVIDVRTVKQLLVGVLTLASSVGPTLLDHAQELRAQHGGGVAMVCTLDISQQKYIHEALGHNTSCSFNVISNGQQVWPLVP
jgi:hypothetical protein